MAAPVTLTERFVLEAGADAVRDLFDDVPAVIGCIPGAAVTADAGDGSYAASVGVQYGETGVRFTGTVRIVRLAPSDISVRAEGQDRLGSVHAEGEIRLTIGAAEAGGTPVDLAAAFTFAGVLAPVARSATRIVGPQLMTSFARCLAAKVSSGAPR